MQELGTVIKIPLIEAKTGLYYIRLVQRAVVTQSKKFSTHPDVRPAESFFLAWKCIGTPFSAFSV